MKSQTCSRNLIFLLVMRKTRSLNWGLELWGISTRTSSPMVFFWYLGAYDLPLGRSCSITTWVVVSSFVFNFHQLFGGNDPFFTNIVSNGLKPPTGNCFRGFPNSWALHMTYVYCVHEGQALGVIITFVSSSPAQPKRFTQVIDKMFFSGLHLSFYGFGHLKLLKRNNSPFFW